MRSSPADLEDDFDRGLHNRRAVLGDAWVDQSLDNTTAFNADFQSLVTRHAWFDIWGRPGLDRTTRRLLVLGMTMAQARWEEFELHCGAALRGGVPLEAIRETLMQGAIYCGVPAANTAFKITSRLLRENGLLPAPQPLSASVRVATHRTFSRPQLQVAVQGLGPGVPVVLSHALGVDLHLWDFAAAALAPQHPVLRYDHRGHGGSAVPAGPYTMDELVDDAARVIREWGRGPVVFIGVSMGGMVAQGLAIRHPELVCGLGLVHTGARYAPEAAPMWAQRIDAVRQGGVAAVAEGSLERFFTAEFRASQPAQVDAVRQTLLRCDPAGYVAACDAVAAVDWLDRLGEVRCPVLIVAGAQDQGTPLAMSEAMAQRLPQARLEVLPVAHLGAAVEQPEAFLQLLRPFLAMIAPTAASPG